MHIHGEHFVPISGEGHSKKPYQTARSHELKRV